MWVKHSAINVCGRCHPDFLHWALLSWDSNSGPEKDFIIGPQASVRKVSLFHFFQNSSTASLPCAGWTAALSPSGMTTAKQILLSHTRAKKWNRINGAEALCTRDHTPSSPTELTVPTHLVCLASCVPPSFFLSVTHVASLYVCLSAA